MGGIGEGGGECTAQMVSARARVVICWRRSSMSILKRNALWISTLRVAAWAGVLGCACVHAHAHVGIEYVHLL